MKHVLFIDRDGTILVEPEDAQIDALDKFAFVPNALTALARIASELDYELVMVTNQDGLGTASFSEETFWPYHDLMLQVLGSVGVRFADVLIDRTLPEQGARSRTPGTAMLSRYVSGGYDLGASFVIGDRMSDVALATNLGTRAILIGADNESQPQLDTALTTRDWTEIYNYLRGLPRRARVCRQTIETDIEVELVIDGSGNARIATGIGYLDHMLEQVAKHSGCDLAVRARGDLHTDEHHTVEDAALTIGEAFDRALGTRSGIGRYGFTLPMDEALAELAIDFSGRGSLEWNAPFNRERIGELPTELIEHFFRSFSDAARCTLHVKARGRNEHHICEAIFKGLGRCLRQVVARSGGAGIPSTKGVL